MFSSLSLREVSARQKDGQDLTGLRRSREVSSYRMVIKETIMIRWVTNLCLLLQIQLSLQKTTLMSLSNKAMAERIV